VRLVVGSGEVVAPPWVQAVGEARGGGAVREIRGGSESMRWAERTKVTRRTVGVKSRGRRRLSESCATPIARPIGSKENTCCMQ
jgi:hypothetical protein